MIRKDSVKIVIPYRLSFCSHRTSEGWDSGYKTLRDFLNKYDLKLVNKSSNYVAEVITPFMQEVYVEQNIVIPFTGKLPKINIKKGDKISIEHLIDPFIKEEWLRGFEAIEIKQHSSGLTPLSFVYLLRIPPRKEWIGITQNSQYEWTLGTINTHYSGPYSLDEESRVIIESTFSEVNRKKRRFGDESLKNSGKFRNRSSLYD